MKKLTLLTAITLLTLSGCASVIDDNRDVAIAITKEKAQLLNEQVNNIPSWFIDVPVPDSTGIYGVGFGESNKAHFSLKMSEVQAKFDLATQIKEVVTGQTRSAESLDSSGNVSTKTTSLIDSVVDSVQLTGIERVKRKVSVIGDKVHSYSLLKMSYEQYNKLLKHIQAEAGDTSMDEAFDNMYKRINEQKALKATTIK